MKRRLKPLIIDRYIFLESLQFFLITLFAFLGILLTLRMLKFAALIINKGVEFSQIAALFVAIVPPFLEIAIPMATLLGVMLAFARLSGDSELIIFRASGVSIKRLLLPVVIFGIFALLLAAVTSLALRPWGRRRMAAVLFNIARTRTTSGISAGVFNKLEHLTLYAEIIGPKSGQLSNVLIEDRRDPENKKLILAREGTIASDSESQTISFRLKQGTIHELKQGAYAVTKFESNTIGFAPDELLASSESKRGKRSEEMSLTELRHNIADLRSRAAAAKQLTPPPEKIEVAIGAPVSIHEAERRANRMEVEYARRFSLPFAPFVLALIGLPLGIHPPRTQRTWGANLAAVAGLGVFIIYYGILSVGFALADSGILSPRLSLWLPNLVVLAIGLWLQSQIGNERWQSIADGLGSIWSRLPRRTRVPQ